MDMSDWIALSSAIATAFGGGYAIGYRTGFVKANPSEKTKCYKQEGSRGSQVTVMILRSFFRRSFSCRLKKGDTCLLDNTKCDFKP